MKKLILLFLTLTLLSACTSTQKELGYSLKQIRVISKLSEKNQAFFSEYKEEYATLLDSKSFDETKFDIYKLFINYIDASRIVELVNNGIISNKNYALVKRLTQTKDFNLDNIDKYIKEAKVTSNLELVVTMVNNNIKVSDKLAKELGNDPYFISENLALYVKYYDSKKTTRENVEYVNTYNYLEYYEDGIYAEPDKYSYLVQVNKFYYLGKDYNPDDLVDLTGYGMGSLRKIAYDAYVSLSEAAANDKVSFYATSSYRSYETQVRLYNNYLSNDSQSDVDTYSARPGFSDHQSGYTVDILTTSSDFDTFYKTEASKWLKENAYKYGFICRYPEGKENITGYEYEPWHYRYIGIEAAAYIHETGITFDEYFEVFVKEW